MNNLLYKNDIIELETGFGGLAIIRKDVYLKNILEDKIPNYARKYEAFKENFICEHWNSCNNVRKYGKIYFVRDAEALWIEEKYYKNIELIDNYINDFRSVIIFKDKDNYKYNKKINENFMSNSRWC